MARIVIPSPAELGLPEKFASWRPTQIEMLRYLLESPKRTKALSAPTGSGKSPVIIGYALMTKQATCIVTDSRALQDQYLRDFAEIGLVDIRGRRNYSCELRPHEDDYTCENGYAAGCPYKGSISCPSSQAEMRAATSMLVVTNYDKWTAAKKYGQGMSHFQQVVFDEGHEAPNALGRAMQVVLNHRERERVICLDPPVQSDSMQAWKVWAIEARAVVEAELKLALDAIRHLSNPPPGRVRHALHMQHLYRRLGTLSTCNPLNWVVEEVEKGFQFDPVRPGRYAESHLLLRVPSVVIISATLRPKTLFLIGQGLDTFDFREFNSEFDSARNPIYWVPTLRVDAKQTDLSMLYVRFDQIAAKRRDRKGIVHTVSYARRDEFVARSRFADSMFLNEKGEAPTPMIEEFKAAGDGAILVSPSVGQGHDFPMSTCEWQLLCKVPFPPPSKILKARTQDDPEYPYYLAMQKMVQTFGRGMRSTNDQCVSPETRILTGDLHWREAGSLRIGDRLLGISEYGDGFNRRDRTNPRHWEWSQVVTITDVKAPRVRVIFEDGELICTPEHPLLMAEGHHRTAIWIAADNLKVGDKLLRLLNTWDAPESYLSGWLAGFTDGEGSLIRRESSRNPNVSGLWIAQNEGAALTNAKLALTMMNYDYRLDENKRCRLLKLKGGYPELLRFLGNVRPVRLLGKFKADRRGERVKAISYPKVRAIEKLNLGPIVRMSTSTKTYIAEGLGSHNCENFLVDDHIEWFLPRYGHLAPKSFHLFFRRADTLPQPPARLPR